MSINLNSKAKDKSTDKFGFNLDDALKQLNQVEKFCDYVKDDDTTMQLVGYDAIRNSYMSAAAESATDDDGNVVLTAKGMKLANDSWSLVWNAADKLPKDIQRKTKQWLSGYSKVCPFDQETHTIEKENSNPNRTTVIPMLPEGQKKDDSGRIGRIGRIGVFSFWDIPVPDFLMHKSNLDNFKVEDTRLIDQMAWLQENDLSLLFAPDGSGKSTWLRIYAHYFLESHEKNCVVFLTENYLNALRDQAVICKITVQRFFPFNLGELNTLESIDQLLDDIASWWIGAHGGGKMFLCIDTLTKLVGVLGWDSNAPKDMAKLLAAFAKFRDFCAEHGAIVHVCFSYHSKKNNPNQYSGAKEISNQCNTRMRLDANKHLQTTTIELVAGQGVNVGNAMGYKLTDKKQVTRDYNQPTRWELVEGVVGASERTRAVAETLDERKAYAAVVWTLSKGKTHATGKDVGDLLGWDHKHYDDVLTRLYKAAVITASRYRITLPDFVLIKPDMVSDRVNGQFCSLPAIVVSTSQFSDGGERLVLKKRESDGGQKTPSEMTQENPHQTSDAGT